MNYLKKVFVLLLCLIINKTEAQTKILFDATKAETAGNADWIIDADTHNLGYSNGPAVIGQGNESNPARMPTPAQSGISSSTLETYWNGALSNWGVDCVKQGYEVETLPYNGTISYGNTGNPQDLSNYKVFIVCEPNILFTAAEKAALMNFIQNGGGLFMISDHDQSDRNNDGQDSPHIWNDFITNNTVQNNAFGMSFDYQNFSETTTNIPALPGDSILHGIMGNVTEALWSNGTSITLNPTQNASIKGVIYKTGSAFGNTNAMCAYARYGNGKIAAIGDSSPCDDGSGDSNDQLYNGYITDAAGNHRLLLMNITIWLATTNSITTINSVNYSTNNSVIIYPNPATNFITINTTTLTPIKIINLVGETVLTTFNTNNIIDISNLSKGIYFVQTQAGQVTKLIKE